MSAMHTEGRLGDEMYLNQFAYKEAQTHADSTLVIGCRLVLCLSKKVLRSTVTTSRSACRLTSSS